MLVFDPLDLLIGVEGPSNRNVASPVSSEDNSHSRAQRSQGGIKVGALT